MLDNSLGKKAEKKIQEWLDRPEDFKEIWLPVIGYEGKYEISNTGIVKGIERVVITSNGRRRLIHERLLNIHEYGGKGSDGYRYVVLSNPGLMPLLHRFVAQHFIPNPENKPEVNHKNGKKGCCESWNLEWVTSKENARHKMDTGLQKPTSISKLKEMSIQGKHITCIETGKSFISIVEAVRTMHLTGDVYERIRNNKPVNGYTFVKVV